MTQKDYIKIAAAIAQAYKVTAREDHMGIDNAVEYLAEMLEKDNPRFNRLKFTLACGLEG